MTESLNGMKHSATVKEIIIELNLCKQTEYITNVEIHTLVYIVLKNWFNVLSLSLRPNWCVCTTGTTILFRSERMNASSTYFILI